MSTYSTPYIQEIRDIPLLTSKETIELFILMHKGNNEAKEKLIKHNMKLVLSIAFKFQQKNNLPLDDLINMGSIGLIKAVNTFDHTKNFAFSTYAYPCITRELNRNIKTFYTTIKIPEYMLKKINDLNIKEKELSIELGYKPSTKELADYLNISIKEVEEMKTISTDPISLQTPLKDGEDSTLENFIPDTTSLSPESALFENIKDEKIQIILNKLTRYEREILLLRYGLINGVSHSCEEIGKLFGISSQAINGTEKNAIKKLKHPRVTKEIKDFLEEEI